MVSEFIVRAFEEGSEENRRKARKYLDTKSSEGSEKDSASILHIIPNGYHSLDSKNMTLEGQDFTFTKTHHAYKQIMHFERMQRVDNYRQVLIIDSGIVTNHQLNVVKQVDFLSAYEKENSNSTEGVQINNLSNSAIDEYGHGTAIANIINDVCPNVPLVVYKIANESGVATEWDLIAALIAKNDVKIINVSLSYGLPKINCSNCGRLSASTRSYVMEYVLAHAHYDLDFCGSSLKN